MIPFNRPPFVGKEPEYIKQVIESRKLCGDGAFTRRCHEWIERETGITKALLTTSGTDALEMAAVLCDLKPGDEVIMPSFTFSSTANAFVLRGATIVFVDIRPDTMNLDEEKIEAAITDQTRVIVPVHYAGVACEMNRILEIAKKHHLLVVEDAAQAVRAYYHGKALGTFGDFGCYSFHETKNYSMGEGGALLVQDPERAEAAEIIREKGTNRSRFLRGQVDKYTWVDLGSSYLPSELNAAYLYAELEEADTINEARLHAWDHYHQGFEALAAKGLVERPTIPEGCAHNAHMYYLKAKDLEERTALIAFLKERGVGAVFHYVPLHSAEAGLRFGRFDGVDEYTTKESERLLRLPMYYGLTDAECDTVIQAVYDFYRVTREG